MRLTDTLEIPDALEEARLEGKLVVFAGSGVSVPAPASLLDFPGLAREIGESVYPLTQDYEGALDRYLGKLKRSYNVDVEGAARRLLGRRRGQYNEQHKWLLGLFRSHDSVRLVTTNFDGHFNAALGAVFPGMQVPEYVGPALPPGKDFRGIARLHGALDHHAELVLTAQSFAAAYMTNGWAARFLVELFATRTVLFVGYGNNDPVIRYLLSALPPSERWYALCPSSEASQWSESEVRTLTFKEGAGSARYDELDAGLKRWYWYAQATAIDHTEELERIVTLGPPSSPLDADYLRARLRLQTGRATFWRNATSSAWFWWALDQGFLKLLFERGDQSEQLGGWGQWVTTNFADGQRPELLEATRRTDLTIHPQFAFQLCLWLWRLKSLPRAEVTRQYVALMVACEYGEQSFPDPFVYLLERLTTEGMMEEACALLRRLTRVRLRPRSRLALSFIEEEEGAAAGPMPALATEMMIATAPGQLSDYLGKNAERLAAAVPFAMFEIGVQRLSEAYEAVWLAAGDSSVDWLSFSRSTISGGSEARYAEAVDVLVTVLQVAAKAVCVSEPGTIAAFGLRHANDRRGLFRRLAIEVLGGEGVDSEAALTAVEKSGWIADIWVRPELYVLLKRHFPRLAESRRVEVIRFLKAIDMADENEERGRAVFDLSCLLARVTPDSNAAQDFAKEQRLLHPRWEEQDEDGLLIRTNIRWGGDEPSSVGEDEVLRLPPDQALAALIAGVAGANGTGARMAVLGVLQGVAKRDSAKAIGLLGELVKSASVESAEIGSALMWGLRESQLSVDEQISCTELLLSWAWPASCGSSVGSLAEKWSREIGDSPNEVWLTSLDLLADRLFERAEEPAGNPETTGEWTAAAINHSAGKAASVWWMTANARDRRDHRGTITISSQERARWGRVVTDRSQRGTFARPIAGMAVERLGNGDRPWAESAIYPLFLPSNGEVVAAQLWDGRLSQSRWSWGVVSGLMPAIREFLDCWQRLLPKAGKRLGDVVALFALHATESGFDANDLQKFAKGANEEALVAFAEAIVAKAKKVSSEQREVLWDSLLQPYWERRREGLPTRPTAGECGALIEWVLGFPERADSVLRELELSPLASGDRNDSFLFEWERDSEWPKAHPTTAANLVRIMAKRGAISAWFGDVAVKVLRVCLEAGAERGVVLAAAMQLVELPNESANTLVRELRQK